MSDASQCNDETTLCSDSVFLRINEDLKFSLSFVSVSGSSMTAVAMRAAVVVFVQTIIASMRPHTPCELKIEWSIVSKPDTPSPSLRTLIHLDGHNLPENNDEKQALIDRLRDVYTHIVQHFRLPQPRRRV